MAVIPYYRLFIGKYEIGLMGTSFVTAFGKILGEVSLLLFGRGFALNRSGLNA